MLYCEDFEGFHQLCYQFKYSPESGSYLDKTVCFSSSHPGLSAVTHWRGQVGKRAQPCRKRWAECYEESRALVGTFPHDSRSAIPCTAYNQANPVPSQGKQAASNLLLDMSALRIFRQNGKFNVFLLLKILGHNKLKGWNFGIIVPYSFVYCFSQIESKA